MFASKSVNNVARAAIDAFGSIDILVNNAGFTRDKYLAKMPESDWDDVVNTILKGALLHQSSLAFNDAEKVGPHHQYQFKGSSWEPRADELFCCKSWTF